MQAAYKVLLSTLQDVLSLPLYVVPLLSSWQVHLRTCLPTLAQPCVPHAHVDIPYCQPYTLKLPLTNENPQTLK